jgi:hypothetical protein
MEQSRWSHSAAVAFLAEFQSIHDRNPTMTQEPTFDRLLVLLDPSSRNGDSGAKLARSLVGRDGSITLAVALSGPEAAALVAYATAESITVKEAAEIYLRQTIATIGSEGVSSTLVDGTDLATDLVGAVEASTSGGAVIPAAMADRARLDRPAWESIGFPVIIVPMYRIAA